VCVRLVQQQSACSMEGGTAPKAEISMWRHGRNGPFLVLVASAPLWYCGRCKPHTAHMYVNEPAVTVNLTHRIWMSKRSLVAYRVASAPVLHTTSPA
jgi:hypothetical protein